MRNWARVMTQSSWNQKWKNILTQGSNYCSKSVAWCDLVDFWNVVSRNLFSAATLTSKLWCILKIVNVSLIVLANALRFMHIYIWKVDTFRDWRATPLQSRASKNIFYVEWSLFFLFRSLFGRKFIVSWLLRVARISCYSKKWKSIYRDINAINSLLT